jgi:glyceraldehyde 3-phosphate dehydrogenase
LECTGQFKRRPELEAHLGGDPEGVVLGQPGEVDQMIVVGVNDDTLDASSQILSAASCTTNATAPVLSVLDDAFGVRWGLVGTVHAQTAAQRVVDGPAKDFRRGRAGGCNIVPTSTGAARALTQVVPALAGKLDGQAIRVPVTDGSLFEVTCTLGDSPTLDRVLDVLRAASRDAALRGILDVRRVGWYDNEAAYAARLLDLIVVWAQRRAGAEG